MMQTRAEHQVYLNVLPSAAILCKDTQYDFLSSSVDSLHQLFGTQQFHLGESKPLLAQVLDGCTDMIHRLIDAEKAVVGAQESEDIVHCGGRCQDVTGERFAACR